MYTFGLLYTRTFQTTHSLREAVSGWAGEQNRIIQLSRRGNSTYL